ncbi:hypothetical protein [Actinomadura chibensis]|uniref:Uncharacterized protein n=1 Tax=Actinomadura chibensis TaxID=392828 RepID=A0A5D0NLH4_9ACTN|nr:hypothetical protein [Actinomadura chibensis]TYB44984.1 hypothetical protein FXF69_22940 [Actinomadura chibensis]
MALIAALSALGLVIALTVRDHKLLGPGGTGAAVMMWAAAPLLLLIKLKWYGWSAEKTLWSAAALLAWAVLCGTGRPGLLLSTLFMDEPNVPQRLILRSFIGQAVFVVGIIAFALVDAFA